MSPAPLPYDLTRMLSCYLKLFREGLETFPKRVKRSEFNYFFRVQPSKMVLLSFSNLFRMLSNVVLVAANYPRWVHSKIVSISSRDTFWMKTHPMLVAGEPISTLRHHIPNIVSLCSGEKVGRPYASRVIAVVAYIQRRLKCPIHKLILHSVRQDLNPGNITNSVSLIVHASDPFPAIRAISNFRIKRSNAFWRDTKQSPPIPDYGIGIHVLNNDTTNTSTQEGSAL